MSMFYELMMRKKGMPSRYQKVEYIESTGTQYIDTGVYLTGDSRVKIKFQLTNTTYKGERIFGSQFPNETFRFGTGGDVTWRVGYWDSTSVSLSTPSPALNVLYEIDFNKTEFYLNNNLIHTFTKKDFTATHTAYLFNVHYTNNTDFVVAKVYSCQIYDNNRLVRNFIPVYDTLTNKYGMWESVQGKFYGNAGTGDFKGSIVGYTIVGSPTITDGVVSGFSSGNYIYVPNFDIGNDFEFITKIKLLETNNNNYLLRLPKGNVNLNMSLYLNNTNKINLALNYNNKPNSVTAGTTVFNLNTDIYIKIIQKGNITKLFSSLDKSNWIEEMSIQTDKDIRGSGTGYDMSFGIASVSSGYYFHGEIYIGETIIKINNKLWFNGQPA